MYVTGAGTAYIKNAWSVSSRKVKENISDLPQEGSLSRILSLNPVRFDFITGQKNCLGFVAEDVEPIIPEMVHEAVHKFTENEKGEAVPAEMVKAMSYNFLFPHLVNVAKDHQDMIDSLSSRVEDLEAEVLALRALLTEQKGPKSPNQ
jgi:hypothetical protein